MMTLTREDITGRSVIHLEPFSKYIPGIPAVAKNMREYEAIEQWLMDESVSSPDVMWMYRSYICSALLKYLQIPSFQWGLGMRCKTWPTTCLQLWLWFLFLYFPSLPQSTRYTSFLMSSKDWSDTPIHKEIMWPVSSKGCWNILNMFVVLAIIIIIISCSAGI